ncbi:hypothetical protein PR048_012173 [Dryococelus australis]|uniref:Uncharacterized protein n=1 Tax=Dryococelus australis TaxID=614101 RepID=A0ABQ9HNZ9_9NEOP|nr:hypothetical protein PR048_012173 [Dryococelus australis]
MQNSLLVIQKTVFSDEPASRGVSEVKRKVFNVSTEHGVHYSNKKNDKVVTKTYINNFDTKPTDHPFIPSTKAYPGGSVVTNAKKF